MTVKELKEALENLDDSLPVYMSTDPEGNGFRELYSIESENCGVDAGDHYYLCLTPEMEKEGFTEEDVWKDCPLCIILWP